MRRLLAKSYILAAKQLNDDLGRTDYSLVGALELLKVSAASLAEKEGWDEWKSVKGTPANEMPFELWMEQMGGLCIAWCAWLLLAKCRDRALPKERLEEYRVLISDIWLAGQLDIFAEWDSQARHAVIRDILAFGDRRQHIRLGLWPDLSVLQKIKVFFRRVQ